jgi:hypothetical protein
MSSPAGAGHTTMAKSEVRFVVGAVTRTDIPALCARLADLLRGRPGGIVVCDVAGAPVPDLVLVEALARLRLTARRHGRRLYVTGAGPGLPVLIDLLGLADVLPQAGWQAEEREQPGGVEEVVDAGDPPV